MLILRNKRAFLARQFRRTGLLRWLERWARRPGLLVLAYHRIGPRAEDPFYEGVFSATPEDFAAQLRYLRDHFRLLALDELLNLAEAGFPFDEPSALITFDDGYRDNLELAWPILRDLAAPVALFIPTDFLDHPHLFWWDHVAYTLKRTSLDRIVLDRPVRLDLDLRPISRSEAIWRVVRPMLDAHPDDLSSVLAHLDERAAVVVDEHDLARALFLTWDEVRQLAEAGVAIGSHARSHRNLARLSEPDQAAELIGSKQTLERELGREITALAYPFGVTDAFTATTQRLAREADYRLAFAFQGGVNRPGAINPFAIQRVNIGLSDTTDLFRARAVLATALGSSPL
jgi:peptidoglycan/xylan/chitin deacetylase (PgdA/CDA1 family)